MKRHQRGITLVELLITLAILSMVGVLIWGIFFQGTKYSNKAMTTNQIQQEANIIISSLTNIHQKSEYFIVEASNHQIKVTYKHKDSSEEKTELFQNNRLVYSIDILSNGVSLLNQEIIPGMFNPEVILKIKDAENADNQFEVKSLLHRLGG